MFSELWKYWNHCYHRLWISMEVMTTVLTTVFPVNSILDSKVFQMKMLFDWILVTNYFRFFYWILWMSELETSSLSVIFFFYCEILLTSHCSSEFLHTCIHQPCDIKVLMNFFSHLAALFGWNMSEGTSLPKQQQKTLEYFSVRAKISITLKSCYWIQRKHKWRSQNSLNLISSLNKKLAV